MYAVYGMQTSAGFPWLILRVVCVYERLASYYCVCLLCCTAPKFPSEFCKNNKIDFIVSYIRAGNKFQSSLSYSAHEGQQIVGEGRGDWRERGGGEMGTGEGSQRLGGGDLRRGPLQKYRCKRQRYLLRAV